MEFLKVLVFLLIHFQSGFSDKNENKDLCTTSSCVLASSTILRNLDTTKDPCDDFYDYACGRFSDELGVPDEKATINTLNRITERVLEFIYSLADVDLIEGEPKTHRISKVFYKSCLNTDKINELGGKPLDELLKKLGGFPMLEGRSWNESSWDWNAAISKLRNFIQKVDVEGDFYSDTENQVYGFTEVDPNNVESAYKDFLLEVVRIMTKRNTNDEIEKEVDDLIEFEKKLDDLTQKYRTFVKAEKEKNHGKLPKSKSVGQYKIISWLNQFQPSVFSNGTAFIGDVGVEVVKEFAKFLSKTPKRTFANYISTRIVSRGVYYLGEEFRNAILQYDHITNGNEDYEQRWKLCGVFITDLAPVAIGSMYIKRYFFREDKIVAKDIMDHVFDAYRMNIRKHKNITDDDKTKILNYINLMHKYIGYADQLETEEGETFYDEFPDFPEDKFFNFAMALNIFNANRAYGLVSGVPDWSKYSKPSTANAFFNARDHSVQFPAGIIQDPNFDPRRTGCMNFGALGGIISHELTHSFDTVVSILNDKNKVIDERKKCIVKQYSSQRVFEAEEASDGEKVFLNGTRTLREDFADMGAVKLSYEAYKSWELKHHSKTIPIGLNNFTLDQIFWISHAQTFCAYERASTTKFKVEEGKYSVERFRVLVPLRNSEEFAKSFDCGVGSNMVIRADEKCLLW